MQFTLNNDSPFYNGFLFIQTRINGVRLIRSPSHFNQIRWKIRACLETTSRLNLNCELKLTELNIENFHCIGPIVKQQIETRASRNKASFIIEYLIVIYAMFIQN